MDHEGVRELVDAVVAAAGVMHAVIQVCDLTCLAVALRAVSRYAALSRPVS